MANARRPPKINMEKLKDHFTPWHEREANRAKHSLPAAMRAVRAQPGYYAAARKEEFSYLPIETRLEAIAHFNRLCLKWADRIAKTPRFKNVLRMAVANLYKNPGAVRAAGSIGGKTLIKRKRVRAGLKAFMTQVARGDQPFTKQLPRVEPDKRTSHLPI